METLKIRWGYLLSKIFSSHDTMKLYYLAVERWPLLFLYYQVKRWERIFFMRKSSTVYEQIKYKSASKDAEVQWQRDKLGLL